MPTAGKTKNFDREFDSELLYFSDHGNGFTNYYHFTIPSNGEKTVTIGFYATEEFIASGDAAVVVSQGATGENGDVERVILRLNS